ncbi:MAG: hypothetical protein NT126_07415 [Bacteroidetes bacterium]|nr:hypothetical protein [Bacteroidota bacterium]
MNAGYFIRKKIVNGGMEILNLFPDALLVQNKKFKNLHKGERCFILGSGHSVMTHDLTKLKSDLVITQNHFHAHKDIGIINPKYHIVIPKFHPSEYDKDWIDWIKSMEEKLPSATTFFFGKNTKPIIDSETQISDRSFYINHGFHAICLHKAKVEQCITIALYMGFSKIYLVGFDLDQVCQLIQGRDNVRFYGHSQITRNEAEKSFEESYASSGFDFFNQWMIWRQLNLLKEYAEKNNIEIINAANGGMLNVYPRVKYDSLF